MDLFDNNLELYGLYCYLLSKRIFTKNMVYCNVSIETMNNDGNIDCEPLLDQLKELGLISGTVKQKGNRKHRYYTFPMEKNKTKQINALETDDTRVVKKHLNITEKELKELGYEVNTKTHKFKKEI